jgi:hypothetical protein
MRIGAPAGSTSISVAIGLSVAETKREIAASNGRAHEADSNAAIYL